MLFFCKMDNYFCHFGEEGEEGVEKKYFFAGMTSFVFYFVLFLSSVFSSFLTPPFFLDVKQQFLLFLSAVEQIFV